MIDDGRKIIGCYDPNDQRNPVGFFYKRLDDVNVHESFNWVDVYEGIYSFDFDTHWVESDNVKWLVGEINKALDPLTYKDIATFHPLIELELSRGIYKPIYTVDVMKNLLEVAQL